MNLLLGLLIAALASIGAVTVVSIARLGIQDWRATRREKQPEPVNAIAENCAWRHERRVEARAKWDTDFYELDHRLHRPQSVAWYWTDSRDEK